MVVQLENKRNTRKMNNNSKNEQIKIFIVQLKKNERIGSLTNDERTDCKKCERNPSLIIGLITVLVPMIIVILPHLIVMNSHRFCILFTQSELLLSNLVLATTHFIAVVIVIVGVRPSIFMSMNTTAFIWKVQLMVLLSSIGITVGLNLDCSCMCTGNLYITGALVNGIYDAEESENFEFSRTSYILTKSMFLVNTLIYLGGCILIPNWGFISKCWERKNEKKKDIESFEETLQYKLKNPRSNPELKSRNTVRLEKETCIMFKSQHAGSKVGFFPALMLEQDQPSAARQHKSLEPKMSLELTEKVTILRKNIPRKQVNIMGLLTTLVMCFISLIQFLIGIPWLRGEHATLLVQMYTSSWRFLSFLLPWFRFLSSEEEVGYLVTQWKKLIHKS